MAGDGTDDLERLVAEVAGPLDPSAAVRPADLERLRAIGGTAAVRALLATCRARVDGRLTSREALQAVEDIEAGEWARVAGRLTLWGA